MPAWNRLLGESRADSLFLTWEWVLTWWEVYGGDHRALHVLAARDDGGRLVGIAPLMVEQRRAAGLWPIRVVKFIGDGGDVTPEYLEIFTAPGVEQAVIEACIASLVDDDAIDAFDFRPLATNSPTHQYLEQALQRYGTAPHTLDDSVSPVLPLPATAEQFLASRSRNYRKKLGEYERRCERDLRASLRVSDGVNDLARDMEALIFLHHKRWKGLSRAFQSEEYLAFHARLGSRILGRNWMRLFTLEGTNGPLALLYCFAYGGRYYFYQAGRDPALDRFRVGLVIMHKVILAAIAEGALAFDFLRGDEDYKYRWATTEVRSVRLMGWKNALLARTSRLYYAVRRATSGPLKSRWWRSLGPYGAPDPESSTTRRRTSANSAV
jgi:CelD/BcsL family acetyltransferase involved in cellulose biosynthesis